jgi:hypothetical protein
VINFAQAREIVANSDRVRQAHGRPVGFAVATFGWESATRYMMCIEIGPDDDVMLGVGVTFVDKRTGEISLEAWYPPIDGSPSAGMTPVGSAPVN